MYVNIGSATNACQVANRQLRSPGQSPCPELPVRAGVWLFDPNGTNQTTANGHHYAMGYRNLVALAMNPTNNTLYGAQHGRDMLFENWPERFTVDQDAVLPEELVRITDGTNNGWPYCFLDAVFQHKELLAPEYGGDGQLTSGWCVAGRLCGDDQLLATFGAHWAPNGITFYTGSQFPAHYRRGAFIAFHGGFDRAPFPERGLSGDVSTDEERRQSVRHGGDIRRRLRGVDRSAPTDGRTSPGRCDAGAGRLALHFR
jgi:glucose/arabinose dehydrogenase